MQPHRTVLILGADGFIGRHLAFGLRSAGWQVRAHARNPNRLAQMGFETLALDLTSAAARDPAFWSETLNGVSHVVNAAGVLNGSDELFERVHVAAPEALYSALPTGGTSVLISAVGIDEPNTRFSRFRREGERVALAHGATVLRPGLVLGDTSYGGSSLLRALSAFPFCRPVVGNGTQAFNPLHAADLAKAVHHALLHPAPQTPIEIGGPETVTQSGMSQTYRRWLGLRSVPVLPLPLWLSKAVGAIGDAMRLGPISRTAVAQLENGVKARKDPYVESLPEPPRGFSEFVFARPAGTQDLWHARLYLLRPFLRIVLAALWLFSGLLGLTLSPDTFLPLLPQSTLPEGLLVAMARLGGLADLALAFAILRGWRPKLIALLQLGMVLAYTIAFSVLSPALWQLPLGGLLKNIPILALIGTSAILEEER